jgi:dephospho-CoA kinase
MNKKIAVTGGIGSGKSTVIQILKEAGYKVLSYDKITAELYQTRKVKLLLKKMFPDAVKGYFFPKLDRKIISAAVFNDKNRLDELTSTITPLVIKEVERRTKTLSGTVFVEVPLLFECNYQNRFDQVWVVKRNKTQRIESVKTRSGLSEEQIVSRITSQVDYDKLDLTPYIVISNDSGVDQLKNTVLKLANNI